MKFAVTLSLLPSSPQRPFLLGPAVADGFRTAAEIGYDAVEIFPPDLPTLRAADLSRWVRETGVPVSTIGSGGGALTSGLSLTHNDPEVRLAARQYVESLLTEGAELSAGVIIGSLQGRSGAVALPDARSYLREALGDLAEVGQRRGATLIYEPLNRYESDLFNSLETAVELLAEIDHPNLKLLADTFHMNIEEADFATAWQTAAPWLGHVHWADSNRQVAGRGHTDLLGSFRTLERLQYTGYLAVEAFPWPDPLTAARGARQWFQHAQTL